MNEERDVASGSHLPARVAYAVYAAPLTDGRRLPALCCQVSFLRGHLRFTSADFTLKLGEEPNIEAG